MTTKLLGASVTEALYDATVRDQPAGAVAVALLLVVLT